MGQPTIIIGSAQIASELLDTRGTKRKSLSAGSVALPCDILRKQGTSTQTDLRLSWLASCRLSHTLHDTFENLTFFTESVGLAAWDTPTDRRTLASASSESFSTGSWAHEHVRRLNLPGCRRGRR